MLKRALFTMLMLAIPVATAFGLYHAYRQFHVPAKKITAVEPRYFVANNRYVRAFIYWMVNKHNFIAIDNGRKAIQQSMPEFIKEKGPEYLDNWAQVLAFVPMPAVGNLSPNVRGKFVNTNDLGYRSPLNFLAQIAEAKRLKAKGVKIGVFTGGSVGFGLYSDDDETDIVGYMNQLSRQRDGNIKFYNFAMGSYTSAEELNALVTYAAALEPDLLVVFDGFNDALRLTEPTAYNAGVGVPFMYLSFRKSHSVIFHSEYLDRVYDVDNVSAEQEAEFFEHYQRNIRLMSRIMTGPGKAMVVATQPISYFKNVCYPAPPHKFYENLKRFYPKMVAAARDISSEQRISYLDLTGVFDGPQDRCSGTFADTVHMTSAGQRVIAERLYSAAAKALDQKQPPRKGQR
jgi:lysophospholipase L1-like esterase